MDEVLIPRGLCRLPTGLPPRHPPKEESGEGEGIRDICRSGGETEGRGPSRQGALERPHSPVLNRLPEPQWSLEPWVEGWSPMARGDFLFFKKTGGSELRVTSGLSDGNK